MGKNNKGRVLIVDDEDMNISMLKLILSPEYAVYASTDGKDALEAATEILPDIILLDIVMPEMDGYAVIAELKKSEKTKDIPVIFLTGMTDSENEKKGLSLGAVDYILKPFTRDLILERVKYHLNVC